MGVHSISVSASCASASYIKVLLFFFNDTSISLEVRVDCVRNIHKGGLVGNGNASIDADLGFIP